MCLFLSKLDQNNCIWLCIFFFLIKPVQDTSIMKNVISALKI